MTLNHHDPDFLTTVTGEELQTVIETFRSRDADGKFQSFGHAVARFAEQIFST